VLLLNTNLTVEEKKPGSHSNLGWELFTDKVISGLSKKKRESFYAVGKNGCKKSQFN
jgi:uracil-DNA glycosylase